MALVTRRRLIAATVLGSLFGGFNFGRHRAARSAPPSGPLSAAASALIANAWKGIDPSKVIDGHVHVVGVGTGNTGCEVGPRMQSYFSPVDYLKFKVYLEAAGITDVAQADQQYITRLQGLLRAQTPHGRALLLAFDEAYDEAGTALTADSEFHTPNEYVLRLAKGAPEVFVAGASVHPWRKDAVEALEKAAEGGAIAVKWLPNAMNINPASPKCDAFYDALVRLKLPLITHAGEEKAVHAEERQRLGNPLLLRRPLERGVTVVVAHCASLGQNPDLDATGQPWVDNFDLFLRLMKEPQWEGRLFGDISALTTVNRIGRPVETVLRDAALQKRLINGSDYPLPAINVLMQSRAVVKQGLITEDERELLNEIDRHDPLLFDFVMKRTLKRVVDEGWQDGPTPGPAVHSEHRLSDDIFMSARLFPRLA